MVVYYDMTWPRSTSAAALCGPHRFLTAPKASNGEVDRPKCSRLMPGFGRWPARCAAVQSVSVDATADVSQR